MLYYLIIIPLVIYAYFAPKFIRKTRYIHYIIATLIAIAGGVIESHNFINEGFLGLSFFIIVMFAGALSQSTIKKRLMTVRDVYAILGYILISAHALAYLLYTLDEGLLFTHIVIPLGLIVYLIFLPLFITSFTEIRKHIPYKQWKTIHKYAYSGYFLLFLHLYLLDNSRSVFYIGLFGIYLVFRMIQHIDKSFNKRKIEKIKSEKLNT